MLQILYNILQKDEKKVLNNDTLAMKLIGRGLGNILLCCFMHSLYLTYFGQLIDCGGNFAGFSETFINHNCWTLGVHVYANHTTLKSTFWNWTYEPVQETILYPGVTGMAEDEDTKVFLTQISKIPMYFMVAVALTLVGKMCWSYLLGSFLHDLVGPLDSLNNDKVANTVLKEEDKELLLDEETEIFIYHIRFYNDILIYYIGCLVLNVLGLFWQAYTIVEVVGGMDPQFGFKVLSFKDVEYVKWPYLLLRVFPSIGLCIYKQVAIVGNIVPYEFMCNLPWNQSYLFLFAALVCLLYFCIVVSCLSLLYHVALFCVPFLSRKELQYTLKLKPNTKAYKGMQYVPTGGIFMLILLAKNVQYNQIRAILEQTRDEAVINRGRFIKIVKGNL